LNFLALVPVATVLLLSIWIFKKAKAF